MTPGARGTGGVADTRCKGRGNGESESACAGNVFVVQNGTKLNINLQEDAVVEHVAIVGDVPVSQGGLHCKLVCILAYHVARQ